jgi:hypothetical protein
MCQSRREDHGRLSYRWGTSNEDLTALSPMESHRRSQNHWQRFSNRHSRCRGIQIKVTVAHPRSAFDSLVSNHGNNAVCGSDILSSFRGVRVSQRWRASFCEMLIPLSLLWIEKLPSDIQIAAHNWKHAIHDARVSSGLGRQLMRGARLNEYQLVDSKLGRKQRGD